MLLDSASESYERLGGDFIPKGTKGALPFQVFSK